MAKQTQRIDAILPIAQVRALKKEARRDGRSFASVLRSAVEEYTGVADTVSMGGDRSKVRA